MAIVSLDDMLLYLDVASGYFTITAANDGLILKYDNGTAATVDIPDGTYSGDGLATAIQTSMNTTLTMAGTVTYSSTTRKFSFGAGANHTLTYTHTGSDAGLTVGFTQLHAAALTITSDIAAGDPTEIVQTVKDGVEAWVKSRCRREFESTTYTNKLYNGTGRATLYLDDFPVTAMLRVSIGKRSAIRITNTSEYTKASVSVTSTGISLEKDGTTDATCLFSAYTTMTTIVAAINALGSGWEAEVTHSDFASFNSNELLLAWGRTVIDDSSIDLYIPEQGLSDFEFDDSISRLYYAGGFPAGNRNVAVSYTSGYSSSTMPDDLTLAVKMATKFLLQRREEESFGVDRYSIEGLDAWFVSTEFPREVMAILNRHTRRRVA
jgi:hypothetical protein